MEQIVRLQDGLFVNVEQVWRRLALSLDGLLGLPLFEIRRLIAESPTVDTPRGEPLAPIEGQEVWAAGVTYERSLAARAEESVIPDPYERVYTAQRPELFFKSTARRTRGPGEPVHIRSDSNWDVPEPELAVICNSRLEIVGYTIGNDVSSRSIEGENTLYVPQAKIYDGSCALGPAIVPAWSYDPMNRIIGLEIRRGDSVVFAGETSTSVMRRRIPELVMYLGRDQTFPVGCVLLTGTGIVPPAGVTLEDGDVITIRIDGLGRLVNVVRRHESV